MLLISMRLGGQDTARLNPIFFMTINFSNIYFLS